MMTVKLESSASEFFVREASTNEIDELVALRKILLSQGKGHYVASSPEEDLAWQISYREWLKKNIEQKTQSINILVSHLQDNCIIGCVIGIIDNRAPMAGCLNGLTGWVQTLITSPKFQRMGVAKAMMKHLFDWFFSQGVSKVALQTTCCASSLYKGLGFRSTGEDFLIKQL